MAEKYKDQLTAFEEELESLIEQRTEINRQIQHLKQVIDSFSALHSVPTNPALAALAEQQVQGMTGWIEQILNEAPREWKTTAKMRELLSFYGISLAKYANASAVIRTVLERLVKRGYAERDPHSEVARYRRDMRPLEQEIKKAIANSGVNKKKS